jgi:hypothetical protein
MSFDDWRTALSRIRTGFFPLGLIVWILCCTVSCDAWIGTMTSNWCRLIDELRSTVGCAADAAYVDAAQVYPFPDMGLP